MSLRVILAIQGLLGWPFRRWRFFIYESWLFLTNCSINPLQLWRVHLNHNLLIIFKRFPHEKDALARLFKVQTSSSIHYPYLNVLPLFSIPSTIFNYIVTPDQFIPYLFTGVKNHFDWTFSKPWKAVVILEVIFWIIWRPWPLSKNCWGIFKIPSFAPLRVLNES